MENHEQIKEQTIQALKSWTSPSMTRWEVESSLELNPLEFLAEINS